MKPKTLLFCATIVAACASIPTPTVAEAAQLATIEGLMPRDLDRAARLADEMIAANPSLREPRLLRADCELQMANQPERSGRRSLLVDAARDFDRALADADDEQFAEPLLRSAEAHYALAMASEPNEAEQEFATGSRIARRAAEGFAQRKGQDNQKLYAKARLIGARCDYRLFAAARKREIDAAEPGRNGTVPASPRTLTMAQTAAAGFAEARIDHPAEAVLGTADIHRWLGQEADVARVYEAGILAAPAEARIHDAYINWMCELGQHDALVGAYRRFVRERSDAPVLRWFQARAIYRRADRLRSEGNFQGAIAVYRKARATFAEYLATMPQHRDATDQWRALCDLAIARCAVDGGDPDGAIEALFRAGETSPLATAYVDGQPRLYDSYGSHFTSCVMRINSALSQSPERALERTLAFNEALLQAYPDRFGFVYNNAAFTARDLGVQLANRGDEAAARELWERSYRYYERAVALSPDDARIVNDCGLMLIYHLNRDFDRARELFDRAISIGTAQLDEMPADTDRRERERLEEAVGDAYQNIAVLLREHLHRPFAEYKPFCEQAIQYYPYKRREAAALLRTNGEQALASTARAALQRRLGAGSSAKTAQAGTDQGSAAEALKKARPEIDRFVAKGDFDSALTVLDKLAKDCKDHAPYQALRGRVNWLLANQARDNGRRGVELFYQDAVRALTKAVELDPEPVEPRQLLAQAQYDAGSVEAAAETLISLLRHLQSLGGGSDAQKLAAHELLANAACLAYANKKGAGDDDQTLLTAARTSMRWLEQQGQLDADAMKRWAATEQWAGAPAEAVNIYVRAAERNPADFAALDQIVNIAAAQKQLPLAIEALRKRNDAGTVWYLGKAQFYLAAEQRQNGKADDAMKTLDAARASFAASMQKNAGYRDSCEQWIAMCIGKQGNIALSVLKDYERAEKLLLEALRLRPDRLNEDLGLLETTKRGILTLVDYYYRKNDLKKVEQISRAAAAAATADVDLQNNAGLFARDYGNQLERAGDKAAAAEMYEQSYKAYKRAVQLDPKNVRLRNDTALIAIYHLERDWEFSRKLVEGAIEDGRNTLANDPPEDANQKQQLEEAVGDCYENLALWHLKHSRDGEAAKAAALASQQYYPGARRPGAIRHLRAAEQLLQGK
ncbi:MAG TPA: hypothetical protein ENI87_09135 [bacterium]|nr:hypothetical protein [bacterium]